MATGTPDLTDINDFLIAESGRVQSNMDKQSRARGYKWNSIVDRSAFPLGMGQQLTKVNYERTVANGSAYNGFDWNQIVLNPTSGSTTNNTEYTVNEIDPAFTTFTFNLYYGALNSNPLTVHDANLSLNFPDQLNSTVYNLEGNVLDMWEDRKQDEYDRICGHKILCDASATETGYDVAWTASAPTSQLTIEYLEASYDALDRDGGADGLDTVQGQMAPLIILESEAQRMLFRNNENHRKDIRYSSDSDILMNPLGIKQAYSNFKYALNNRAPHWDFSDGTWTRRPYYSTSAATRGTKASPGLLYKNAAYATAYMFHPKVLELLVYDPETSYNNGVSFDANSWMGKFKWINQKDNSVNIDGHQGYFRALLASASRPGLPNLGYAFRYKRCAADYNAVSCTVS